jgi:hypothetical protein
MNLTRLSLEATCVDSLDVDKLMKQPFTLKTVVTQDGEKWERGMVEVTCGRSIWMADRITGTLYTRLGKCLSSDRLRMVP